MTNAQPYSVEENAAAVGLHINLQKTEYIRIYTFSDDNHPALRVVGILQRYPISGVLAAG